MSTFGVWECPICREVYEKTEDGHECAVDDLKGRVAELEAENAKLRRCVEAADAYFVADANSLLPLEPQYTEKQIEESEHWLSVAAEMSKSYYAARAEVKP